MAERRLEFVTSDGTVSASIELNDVVDVRRGGADVRLVRRDADPVILTLADVAGAKYVEASVKQLAETRATNRKRAWWRFWDRS